jgi:hypothetical protein
LEKNKNKINFKIQQDGVVGETWVSLFFLKKRTTKRLKK